MKRTERNVLLNSTLVFNSIEGSLTNERYEKILLGRNECRILQLFVRNQNRVITRNEIYQYVWKDRGREVDDSSVTQAISTLCRNLGDSVKSPAFIKTETKRGYTFIGKVKFLEYSDNLPMYPEKNNESEDVRESISASLTKFSTKEPLSSMDKSLANFFQRMGGLFYEDRESERWVSMVFYSIFLVVISLLLFDFNGSQGMLWYLFKRIDFFD